jgi:hypothetical protein
MRDVDAFDRPRRRAETQHVPQPHEAFLGVEMKHLRLVIVFGIASEIQLIEGRDLIANPCGFLEQKRRTRFFHLRLHAPHELRFLAFEYQDELLDLLAVVFTRHAQIARRRALTNTMQETRPIESPRLFLTTLNI